MILFWTLAAFMLAVAVAGLLWPVWSGIRRGDGGANGESPNLAVFRDRCAELERERAEGLLTGEQHEELLLDLQRELLAGESESDPRDDGGDAGPRAGAFIVLLLPAAAVLLYLNFGTVDWLKADAAGILRHQQAGLAPAPAELLGSIRQLTERLREQPEDVQGWTLLARSFLAIGEDKEAVAAFAEAHRIAGNDPALMVEYAEALAQSRGGDLTGRPLELLSLALDEAPRNQDALWLAGVAQLQQENFDEAAAHWQRLVAELPDGSEQARMVRENIAKARQQVANTDASSDAGGQWVVEAVVRLAPELAGRAAPEDVVFVFARRSGSRAPLAVQRIRVKNLPARVSLALSAQVLEDLQTAPSGLELVARVSRSGNAAGSPGDLQGAVQLSAAQAAAEIEIDRTLP